MGLSKKDIEAIEGIARTVMNEGIDKGRKASRSRFKQTEARLYAYPILKQNIKRYAADIEDIKHEDMRKSHDFVLFMSNSGRSPEIDIEDLRAGKILVMAQKIARDEKEIKEIDVALQTIKGDPYFPVISMHYFEHKEQEEIMETCHCTETTLWRNRKALISRINIALYGADAL